MGIAGSDRYQYKYSVYGVTLAANLPLNLPEAGDSDVIVELDLISAGQRSLAGEGIINYSDDWTQLAVHGDRALYMRWGNWFEILVSPDGRRVRCNALVDLPIVSFEAYLTNFAVSAALIQQGEEPLHATVIDIGGRAVGLLGPSGAGKSTLAAVLISRGGVLLTDDMLRVTFAEDVVLAQPGPYRIKLFREPADRYLTSGENVGYWSPFGEKLIFEPDIHGDGRNPQPLSALYYLDAPCPSLESDSPVLERLSGVELFKVILSSSMNSRLHLSDRLRRQFLFAERFARTCPVFRLTYPRDFNLINQVADQICDMAPC